MIGEGLIPFSGLPIHTVLDTLDIHVCHFHMDIYSQKYKTKQKGWVYESLTIRISGLFYSLGLYNLG